MSARNVNVGVDVSGAGVHLLGRELSYLMFSFQVFICINSFVFRCMFRFQGRVKRNL